MELLKDKNILVGVTGSIAIYKTLELIRLYKKAGANVKVIMSSSAKKFVSALTFETISQNSILDDTNEDWSTNTDNNHIAIGKWADIFVIAPITANTINKIANGIADNILTQTILAYPNTKLISPAANTNMLHNPLTQENITALKKCNFKIINTTTKELACRDIGDGAMADIEEIFHQTLRELLKTNYWLNREVILNGGGTIEKIDDVRFISNFSSGKMANALATALYYKGANVSLTTTKESMNLPANISISKIQSTAQMQKSVLNNIQKAKENSSQKPYFFGVAAVSDYTPKSIQTGKLKKDAIGETWELKLEKNIDILKELDKTDIYTIGFKAELDKQTGKDNAIKMLKNKNLDGVCLNFLDDTNKFGGDTNNIELITNKTSSKVSGEKLEISLQLLHLLEGNLNG